MQQAPLTFPPLPLRQVINFKHFNRLVLFKLGRSTLPALTTLDLVLRDLEVIMETVETMEETMEVATEEGETRLLSLPQLQQALLIWVSELVQEEEIVG